MDGGGRGLLSCTPPSAPARSLLPLEPTVALLCTCLFPAIAQSLPHASAPSSALSPRAHIDTCPMYQKPPVLTAPPSGCCHCRPTSQAKRVRCRWLSWTAQEFPWVLWPRPLRALSSQAAASAAPGPPWMPASLGFLPAPTFALFLHRLLELPTLLSHLLLPPALSYSVSLCSDRSRPSFRSGQSPVHNPAPSRGWLPSIPCHPFLPLFHVCARPCLHLCVRVQLSLTRGG